MKKLLIWLFLLTLPLGMFAQDQNVKWWNKFSDLWDLTLRFCNDQSIVWWTKALQISAKPWEEKEICILLHNDWPTAMKIWLNFVDGASTSDSDAKKACQPEDINTYFGRYVIAEDTWFLVNPKQTIKTTVKAKFPEGYAGMAYGCATFQQIDTSTENTGMFKVIARRANFLDIFVDGKINVWLEFTWNKDKIDNLSNSDKLILYNNIVKNTIVSKVNIYNSGNVWVTWNLTASYNYFWFFTNVFESQKFRVMPKLTMPYEFDLPRYIRYIWWPITLKYDASYMPEIFWPDKQWVVKIYDVSTQSETFFMPWRILILIAIYIIYKLSKRKNKNIDNKIIDESPKNDAYKYNTQK